MSILLPFGGDLKTLRKYPEITLTINPAGEQVLFELRGIRIPDIALFWPWDESTGTFHIHYVRGDHVRVEMNGTWVVVNKPGSGRTLALACKCGLRFTIPDISMDEAVLRAYMTHMQFGQSATA